jgi:glucosamine-6-phosphate deaminase
MIAPSLPLVVTTPLAAAREIAAEIAELVAERRREGRRAVLGLATGRTPLEIYDELARMHREQGLELSNVVTFNLDEYLDLAPDHPQCFHSYMRAKFLARTGLPERALHLPASEPAPTRIAETCREYEAAIAAAGGLDLQILGIGRNGHIGFNEPGSARDSRTREVELAATTREDAAAAFGGLERVPTRAITMGVATILAARRLRVLAFGERKREIVARTLEAPVGPAVPSTFLRGHADVKLFLDAAAAGGRFQ